ncbi:dTMP kinase, partial [Bifidobacteriaceae bacterium NR003]
MSFEGIDGVGKTTQVEALKKHLQSLGREVVVTREPGGTDLGKSLREILLHGSYVSSRTE